LYVSNALLLLSSRYTWKSIIEIHCTSWALPEESQVGLGHSQYREAVATWSRVCRNVGFCAYSADLTALISNCVTSYQRS